MVVKAQKIYNDFIAVQAPKEVILSNTNMLFDKNINFRFFFARFLGHSGF